MMTKYDYLVFRESLHLYMEYSPDIVAWNIYRVEHQDLLDFILEKKNPISFISELITYLQQNNTNLDDYLFDDYLFDELYDQALYKIKTIEKVLRDFL